MSCWITRPEICKNEVFDKIKIKVFHPISGRTSQIKRSICKLHFVMINDDPTSFFVWYSDGRTSDVVEVLETGLLGW